MSRADGAMPSAKRAGDVCLRLENEVVTAIIDRPQVKNAINTAVIAGLEAATQFTQDCRARALVLRGARGTFCAGADLRELEFLRQHPAQLNEFMTRLGAVYERLENAPFPVLAVVEGHAVAGGFELLLACDIVLASTTAQIGDRHLEYGLVPAAGSSARLPRSLPPAQANYLLLSGELITGEQAAAWGLVSLAVPAARLEALAERIITRITTRSDHGLATIKTMTANARELSLYEALRRERTLFLQHMTSQHAVEGLTAFVERRAPVFTRQQDVR